MAAGVSSGAHHQAQPGLRKSGKIVKKDEELLARQVERDQLVRGGDGGDGLRVEEGWLWLINNKTRNLF